MSSSGSRLVGSSALAAQEHAAVMAWLSCTASTVRPTAVTTIKAQRRPTAKTGVYRLHGALPDGSAVVAKRCRRETAAVERLIYEEVLPSLPLSRLDFFGSCDEGLGEAEMWLFMQDAGDIVLAADRHIALGQWLAQLHTTAADSATVPAANLPERGLNHYRQRMQRSYQSLQALTAEWGTPARARARTLLEQALALFDQLDATWAAFARLADVMPPTLAHCDFASKNIRVGDCSGEPRICVFDWEMAGWGTPTPDLACLARYSSSAALDAYASVVRRRWPAINAAAVGQAQRVGIVIRCIASIDWWFQGLGSSREPGRLRRLETPVARLRNALGSGEGLGLS